MELSETARALLEAGRAFGAEAAESEVHPLLQELAAEHAAYQASRRRQGHQRFGARFARVTKELGQVRCAEIVAESWPWLKDAELAAVGEDMYKSWRQSRGHWLVAKKRHQFIGAEMAKGSNGIWYACLIAVG